MNILKKLFGWLTNASSRLAEAEILDEAPREEDTEPVAVQVHHHGGSKFSHRVIKRRRRMQRDARRRQRRVA